MKIDNIIKAIILYSAILLPALSLAVLSQFHPECHTFHLTASFVVTEAMLILICMSSVTPSDFLTFTGLKWLSDRINGLINGKD